MPHWDKDGNEQWVCQFGAHICTGHSTWVDHGTELSKEMGCHGNVCDACLETFMFRKEHATKIIKQDELKRSVLMNTDLEPDGADPTEIESLEGFIPNLPHDKDFGEILDYPEFDMDGSYFQLEPSPQDQAQWRADEEMSDKMRKVMTEQQWMEWRYG